MVTRRDGTANARQYVAKYSSVELAKSAAAGKTKAGVAFPVSAPSPAAFRKFVEAGICPFCGSGPWKVIAGHTQRSHGVDRLELRDLCGVTYSTSICSPEVSERCRELAQARPSELLRRPEGQKHRRVLSKAAVTQRVALLQDPETRRRALESSALAVKAKWQAKRDAEVPPACSACGGPCPLTERVTPGGTKYRWAKTCSVECRREIRRRTQLVAAATRREKAS